MGRLSRFVALLVHWTGLKLFSQSFRQRSTHHDALAIGRHHQEFLFFVCWRHLLVHAKVIDIVRHVPIHAFRRTYTHRRPQPRTKRLHGLPERVVDYRDGDAIVLVPGTDGTPQERVIQTGVSNGLTVEITEGLREGDLVLERPNP